MYTSVVFQWSTGTCMYMSVYVCRLLARTNTYMYVHVRCMSHVHVYMYGYMYGEEIVAKI